jgi:phosphatidylinositol alpha-mannosyltransferase
VRIGIVTEYYRPWPGGISEHVHHEAEELGLRGHEVSIVTGPAKQGWQDEGPRVIRLGFEYTFTSNGALSRMVLGHYLLHFRQLLRREAFDVVHVHAPMDPFLGIAALYASECTTVGTFHANFVPSLLWDSLFKTLRPLTGPAWKRMHGRIAVSAEARRSIAEYFPGEYEIIPNGVDTRRFSPDAKPLPELDDGRKKILFVGRSDPRKGLPLLLRAFGTVRRDVPGARLVVVGVERQEVGSLLDELDPAAVEDIAFAGYASPESMPGYFAGCDVFCSPATGQESQGIVLLEAMAAGRPPVAFSIPGYRDVVTDNVDGILIDEISEEKLAAGLTRSLLDDGGRARIAEAGLETASAYAWPNVAERIQACFIASQERASRGSPSAQSASSGGSRG